jgi:hypothetical protein
VGVSPIRRGASAYDFVRRSSLRPRRAAASGERPDGRRDLILHEGTWGELEKIFGGSAAVREAVRAVRSWLEDHRKKPDERLAHVLEGVARIAE